MKVGFRWRWVLAVSFSLWTIVHCLVSSLVTWLTTMGYVHVHDCKSVFPNLVCYYLMARMFPSFLAKAFLAQLNYTQLVPPRCVSFSHRLSLKDILITFQKHNHICRIDGILNKGRLKLKQYLGNRRDEEK